MQSRWREKLLRPWNALETRVEVIELMPLTVITDLPAELQEGEGIALM